MKDIMLNNKIILAHSISSIEITYSMIDKVYSVVARQYGNVCVLFSTHSKDKAQHFYDKLIDVNNCISVDEIANSITIPIQKTTQLKKTKKPTKKKVDSDVK